MSAPGQAAPPTTLTSARHVTPTWCCRESHHITPTRAQAGADQHPPASTSGSTRQVLRSILGESTGDWGCEPAAAIKPPAPGNPSLGSAFCRLRRDWWADQTLENEDPETRPVSSKGEAGGPDTRPAAIMQSSHRGEISCGSELRGPRDGVTELVGGGASLKHGLVLELSPQPPATSPLAFPPRCSRRDGSACFCDHLGSDLGSRLSHGSGEQLSNPGTSAPPPGRGSPPP